MKLWVDDVRQPSSDWEWVKTFEQAVDFYKSNHTQIDKISLDHDLGENTKSGYDFLKWMIYEFGIMPKDPNAISVHSMNPVGRKNMEDTLYYFYYHQSLAEYVELYEKGDANEKSE